MTNTTQTPAPVETYKVYRPNLAPATVYALEDGTLTVDDLEISPEEIAAVDGPTLMYRHAVILTEYLGQDAYIVDPYAAWPVEDRPNRTQTGH